MLPPAANLANKTVITGSAGNDYFLGGIGTFAFVGCAGLDTLDYSAAVTGVTFDLANGQAYNNFNGPTFTVDLFFDVEIFRGGSANDNFIGGPGFHDFIGGAGADTLDYSGATTGVTFDIAQGKSYNNFSGPNVSVDRFSSIELFKGGSGNDVFIGGVGFHALYGGGGFDTLDYSAALTGVTFDFSQNKAYNNFSPTVGVDQFSGISIFEGGNGNDVFIGGAGYHYIIGNGGSDTLDYSSSLSGVTFDLTSGRGYNNFGGSAVTIDQFTDIERFKGGSANDVFIISSAIGSFAAIGGDGIDKLVLDSSFGGQSLDLSDYLTQLNGIEVISLDAPSAVTLFVSDSDVAAIAPLSNALYILGGSDDEVIIAGDWQVVATNLTNPAVSPGDTFTKFHSDTTNTDLFISSEISLPPGGFSSSSFVATTNLGSSSCATSYCESDRTDLIDLDQKDGNGAPTFMNWEPDTIVLATVEPQGVADAAFPDDSRLAGVSYIPDHGNRSDTDHLLAFAIVTFGLTDDGSAMPAQVLPHDSLFLI